jgi:hypothetical protein
MQNKPCFTGSILIFICLLSSMNLIAQDLGEFVKVVTTTKQIFIGELIYEDDDKVTLRTESVGQTTIERKNIRSIEVIDSSRIKDGVYWFDNPQGTRYFFAPNAIGLKKGQGYYQNTWVLFNNVNYGVTNNFSIGGGIVPLFLFGTSETPVWLLPKISIPIKEGSFYLGAGAMVGGIIGADTEPLGILYGSATLGDRDNNLSASLGYGYAGSEVADTPVVNISGMTRISRKFYLLSENYFVPGSDSGLIISFGGRWASENVAVDFGLFRPLQDAGGIIGIPWLGVTIPFGKN